MKGQKHRICFGWPCIVLTIALLLLLACGCSSAPAGSTAGPSGAATLRIQDILTADDIAAVLGRTPDRYLDDLTAATRKTGTCAFTADAKTGSLMYLSLGIVIGEETIRACNYRDPAVPRPGSELSELTILGTRAYLDVQTATGGQAADQPGTCNIQLICIREDIYYYLNTGFAPADQADWFLSRLPDLMERLISHAERRLR